MLVGVVCLVFRKRAARFAVRVNTVVGRAVPFLRPSPEHHYVIGYLFGGAFLILIGLAALLGLIRFGNGQ